MMKFIVLTHFRSLRDSDFEKCRRFRGVLGQDAKFMVASDYKARSQRWRAQITWDFLHWLDQLLYFYGTDLTQLWMIPSVRNHASNMESMKPRNAKLLYAPVTNGYPSKSVPPSFEVSISALRCRNHFRLFLISSFDDELSRNSVYRGPECSGKKPIHVLSFYCKKYTFGVPPKYKQ